MLLSLARHTPIVVAFVFIAALVAVACSSDDTDANASSSSSSGGSTSSGGSSGTSSSGSSGASSSGASSSSSGSSGADGGGDGGPAGTSPVIAGCSILPSNNIFNTPIDALPTHASTAAWLATIGTYNLHLDLGATVDQQSQTYYGIPYNVVHGNAITWAPIKYYSADPDLDWNARAESDCAIGSAHTLVSPCTAGAAASPLLPIPGAPNVEGGINPAANQLPNGDHHILILDQDACKLWETYHSYPDATTAGTWDIFGSAVFDLKSNALRPDTWSSADAAGFPILPLLLRADEASSGTIKHALRFTINSPDIRIAYTWPARHLTNKGTTSTNLPPMGQLFRLKSTFAIPANFNTQARAILQAMKTYGMYIADGGSPMYVTGEPSASWLDATITQVQSVSNSQFEAVDLTPIKSRAGFDPNSGAVPPP